ncbi:MAG: undecaprenyl/decaprenyl-phosphate alpha-N-acetylglucosaminyl 1-phosphate transferase [Acidobacteriota bacterium]|nr:undecaprenyl/decaprenyl-phosphate alpha-N-acetylglucosaminyl 1-phosphate transferase [Acidobacteriota bacterium]
MPPLGAYGAVAAVAAVATFALGFPVRRLASRLGLVAEPDERRVHRRATPTGGGAAMFVAFLLAMLVASLLPGLQGVFAGSSEPLGLVLGAAIIFAVGLIDDVREMSAPAKMAGQVLAAMVLVFLGVTMFQFKIPFVGFLVLSPQLTPLLTAVWVVVITNAVNLIDGLDGLAAGVVAIAAGALAVYGLRLMDLGVLPADNLGPLIAAIACGVCVGFLPHNFHEARAFMGDAGALFLGLLMAAATMVIGGRTPAYSGQSYFFFAPLALPLFILGVPIADMAFAFVRRTARGTSFDTPDKDHLHHRLLRLGHGTWRTVSILWAWTAVLSGLVLAPLFWSGGNAVVPFVLAALALALYTLFHPGLRKGEGDHEANGAPRAGATVTDPVVPAAVAAPPAAAGVGGDPAPVVPRAASVQSAPSGSQAAAPRPPAPPSPRASASAPRAPAPPGSPSPRSSAQAAFPVPPASAPLPTPRTAVPGSRPRPSAAATGVPGGLPAAAATGVRAPSLARRAADRPGTRVIAKYNEAGAGAPPA